VRFGIPERRIEKDAEKERRKNNDAHNRLCGDFFGNSWLHFAHSLDVINVI
jgi:hypothetical protein